MIKVSASVCIDAPHDVVWERLARLEDIQLWSSLVRHARCEGNVSRGVGAERTCELVNNAVIHERWTGWDEGRSFRYEALDAPLMKRATNLWTVVAEGERQTLLSTQAEVEIKGGWLGKALEPLFALMIRRMASRPLAAFKYLVEHGRPFEGNPSRLPKAPATC